MVLVKICLVMKNFSGISSISGVHPWLGWAQDSLLGLPWAWSGTSAAADVVVWELACGNDLSLVWAWCRLADFILGPAVKMSFSLFKRALPCGQAQAVWHRAQKAKPVTAGHCQGQPGHLLSFVSIYSTRAKLLLTPSIFPGTWHVFI